MPQFEDLIKLLVLFGGLCGVILGSIYMLKLIQGKRIDDPVLHERLADAERRLADLEERADFAERMVSELRDRPALPPK